VLRARGKGKLNMRSTGGSSNKTDGMDEWLQVRWTLNGLCGYSYSKSTMQVKIIKMVLDRTVM